MNYKIALIRGDGIGPEIVNEAVAVIQKVGVKFGHNFEFVDILMGACASEKVGKSYPTGTADLCRSCDAVLLGAVGVPVFSGFNNLYAMLAGPTAGYVFGFLLLCAAYFALERFLNRNRVVGYILPFLLIWGVYACGMGWYLIYFPSTQGAYACFSVCVLPYIVPDILKILLALILSPRIKKALR